MSFDARELANKYIDSWPTMGPSARWLNLEKLFESVYASGLEAGRKQENEACLLIARQAENDHGEGICTWIHEKIKSRFPEGQ